MRKNIRFCSGLFIGLYFFCFVSPVFAQQEDTDSMRIYYVADTVPFTWRFDNISVVTSPVIYHFPDEQDSVMCKRNRKLITVEPTKKNYEAYYNTARSLFHLNRNAEAKQMFLKIAENKQGYYTGTNYYSSDIAGDTASNCYGYGSYSSAYLHDANYYLSEIYIAEENYDTGLKYLRAADKTYPEQYTCGTGYNLYRNNIDGLYVLCYQGLAMHDSIINLILPEYYKWDAVPLAAAIKSTYSAEQIKTTLNNVEASLVFEADTFQTYIYRVENQDDGEEMVEEIVYTSATARVDLFGHQVMLEMPEPEKQNQVFTKEDFLNVFYNSSLYYYLLNE